MCTPATCRDNWANWKTRIARDCGAAVVERRGFRVLRNRLTEDGHCPDCATPIAGMWHTTPRPRHPTRHLLPTASYARPGAGDHYACTCTSRRTAARGIRTAARISSFCSTTYSKLPRQRTGAYLLANPLGFVVPHAGLQYSGAVAAAAYRHVRRATAPARRVLGFTHRGGPPGISVPDIEEYETPLGEVAVDRETMERLAGQRPFRFVAEDRICDHSVEIQLPLLQHVSPGTRVSCRSSLAIWTITNGMRRRRRWPAMCGPDTVFLVSSDLTHYGQAFGYQPFPADSKISARLAHLDRGVMEAAASLDRALL